MALFGAKFQSQLRFVRLVVFFLLSVPKYLGTKRFYSLYVQISYSFWKNALER